jgi:hypothetical protein
MLRRAGGELEFRDGQRLGERLPTLFAERSDGIRSIDI